MTIRCGVARHQPVSGNTSAYAVLSSAIVSNKVGYRCNMTYVTGNESIILHQGFAVRCFWPETIGRLYFSFGRDDHAAEAIREP